MNETQLKQVHIALETANGNTKEAARLLAISPGGLKKLLDQYPELRSYLPDAAPPTEMEIMARPARAPARRTKEDIDEEIAEASKKMDLQVQAGFGAIGVSGGALDEAVALAKFGRLHFNDMRDFTGGGMAKLFCDLMAEVKEVRKDIELNKCDVELTKILREDRSRLVSSLISVYDRVREASMTAAIVEQRKRDAKEAKKVAKPGFSPLASQPAVAMKVEGNVTIQGQSSGQPQASDPDASFDASSSGSSPAP